MIDLSATIVSRLVCVVLASLQDRNDEVDR